MQPTEIGFILGSLNLKATATTLPLPINEKQIKDYVAGFLMGYEEREVQHEMS